MVVTPRPIPRPRPSSRQGCPSPVELGLRGTPGQWRRTVMRLYLPGTKSSTGFHTRSLGVDGSDYTCHGSDYILDSCSQIRLHRGQNVVRSVVHNINQPLSLAVNQADWSEPLSCPAGNPRTAWGCQPGTGNSPLSDEAGKNSPEPGSKKTGTWQTDLVESLVEE